MKTKQLVLPLSALIVILAVALAACGANPSATTTAGTPAANLARPLPLAETLVVGTFKLGGTGNAVTSAQATALIPLWQAYAQLTSSNSAAQAELDAVVTQVQQTLTPAQVQAITAMKLTRQDMLTEMSSLGLSSGGANGSSGYSGTPRASTGVGGFFADGGPGADGIPGTGSTGTTVRPTPNPTLLAQYANRIPTSLMNALVSLLQKTAAS
ncbi:MAG: hypothetical protein WCE68_03795 [Anaerolineales bacterium]